MVMIVKIVTIINVASIFNIGNIFDSFSDALAFLKTTLEVYLCFQITGLSQNAKLCQDSENALSTVSQSTVYLSTLHCVNMASIYLLEF